MNENGPTLKEEFILNFPLYRKCADFLYLDLNNLFIKDLTVNRISYRIKPWESIEQKFIRKPLLSLDQVPDIIGIEIIVNKKSDIKFIYEKFICENYNIIKYNYEYISSENDSLHVVISGFFPFKKAMNNMLAELRIRTTVADALVKLMHEVHYKDETDESDLREVISKKFTSNSINSLEYKLDKFISVLEIENVHEKRDVHPLIKQDSFLLSPASEVYSEQQIGFGTQFIIDFLVRKPNGSYVLVEIENPNQRIYTKSGSLTAAASHAISQVVDWQNLIEKNLPAAQDKFPDITSPEGIVVIGRAKDLSISDIARLKRMNINTRGRLTILTYDDLIADARAYINSMRKNLC